jgi:hypothetical protein
MQNWFCAHYEVLKDFAGLAITTVGLIVTAILAIAGLRTFGRWRREKVEEKKIEIAIDALAIGYEARLVFGRIRSRLVRNYEYDDLPPESTPERRNQKGGPYVVLKRINSESEFFERAMKAEPKFVALFGTEGENIFELLFSILRNVQVTAEALIDEYRIEPEPTDQETRERRREWRATIFASPGKPAADDEVGKQLQEFRSRIEVLCRPIVEKEFKKPTS